MKIKTSELSGAALDWAVGDIEFKRLIAQGSHVKQWVLDDHEKGLRTDHYSSDWLLGGPIIERERIKVAPNLGGSWHGQLRHTKDHPLVSHPVLAGWTNQHGPTPLIAAMRCFCASKLGEEVEIPDELIKG